jgi:hypothetical protein
MLQVDNLRAHLAEKEAELAAAHKRIEALERVKAQRCDCCGRVTGSLLGHAPDCRRKEK